MARLTLARKIAAITLTLWKKGANFDPQQLSRQAAWAFPRAEAFPSLAIALRWWSVGSEDARFRGEYQSM